VNMKYGNRNRRLKTEAFCKFYSSLRFECEETGKSYTQAKKKLNKEYAEKRKEKIEKEKTKLIKKTCSHTETTIVGRNKQICARCGKYIKFLSKKELKIQRLSDKSPEDKQNVE